MVLDEAHYLGDSERGVVWEEVIIYLPPRVRLLLLSATVENAEQLARWLEFVRGEGCATVFSDERPVPLYPLFLMPDGEVTPLRRRGELFPKVRHFLESAAGRRDRDPRRLPPIGHALKALEATNLLPAIFFLKSRNDCDLGLSLAAGSRLARDPARHAELLAEVDAFLEAYPFLRDHPQLGALRSLQVPPTTPASAHWKLLVNGSCSGACSGPSSAPPRGGGSIPARTVVITQSDRFNGREFVELSATDLLQMTGRAGRRGMDKIGFCLAVPGPFNDVPLIASLLRSAPEPIESQISINFSMVLNLLLSQRPAEIKQLLGLSLATFQRLERAKGSASARRGRASSSGNSAGRSPAPAAPAPRRRWSGASAAASWPPWPAGSRRRPRAWTDARGSGAPWSGAGSSWTCTAT